MNKNIQLHDTSTFDRRFERHYRGGLTQREAYENTESEFESAFGHCKYSSFESFINTYYRRVRKEIKN